MNRWMIVGVSLLFFTACSKDDDGTSQSGNNNNNMNGGAVLSFSSSISASIVVDVIGPGTRAPLTTLEPNAQVGIFGIPAIQGASNSDCDLFNKNVKVIFSRICLMLAILMCLDMRLCKQKIWQLFLIRVMLD